MTDQELIETIKNAKPSDRFAILGCKDNWTVKKSGYERLFKELDEREVRVNKVRPMR